MTPRAPLDSPIDLASFVSDETPWLGLTPTPAPTEGASS